VAIPFYNQGDQNIYAGGAHYIPQEQYRLNYNPTDLASSTKALSGINSTRSASPYLYPQGGSDDQEWSAVKPVYENYFQGMNFPDTKSYNNAMSLYDQSTNYINQGRGNELAHSAFPIAEGWNDKDLTISRLQKMAADQINNYERDLPFDQTYADHMRTVENPDAYNRDAEGNLTTRKDLNQRSMIAENWDQKYVPESLRKAANFIPFGNAGLNWIEKQMNDKSRGIGNYGIAGMDQGQKGMYDTLASQGLLYDTGNTGFKTATGKNFNAKGYAEGQAKIWGKDYAHLTEKQIIKELKEKAKQKNWRDTYLGKRYLEAKAANFQKNKETIIDGGDGKGGGKITPPGPRMEQSQYDDYMEQPGRDLGHGMTIEDRSQIADTWAQGGRVRFDEGGWGGDESWGEPSSHDFSNDIGSVGDTGSSDAHDFSNDIGDVGNQGYTPPTPDESGLGDIGNINPYVGLSQIDNTDRINTALGNANATSQLKNFTTSGNVIDLFKPNLPILGMSYLYDKWKNRNNKEEDEKISLHDSSINNLEAKNIDGALIQQRNFERKDKAPHIYGTLTPYERKLYDKSLRRDKEEKIYRMPVLTVAQGGRVGYFDGGIAGLL